MDKCCAKPAGEGKKERKFLEYHSIESAWIWRFRVMTDDYLLPSLGQRHHDGTWGKSAGKGSKTLLQFQIMLVKTSTGIQRQGKGRSWLLACVHLPGEIEENSEDSLKILCKVEENKRDRGIMYGVNSPYLGKTGAQTVSPLAVRWNGTQDHVCKSFNPWSSLADKTGFVLEAMKRGGGGKVRKFGRTLLLFHLAGQGQVLYSFSSRRK